MEMGSQWGRAGGKSHCQAKRIKRAARDFIGSQDLAGKCWFSLEGVFDADFLHWNTANLGLAEKGWSVSQIGVIEGDEIAAIKLNTLLCNATQDDVFLNTFNSSFSICHTVARTRMQQPMRTSGGAGSQFAPLNNGHVKAALGQVICQRTASKT